MHVLSTTWAWSFPWKRFVLTFVCLWRSVSFSTVAQTKTMLILTLSCPSLSLKAYFLAFHQVFSAFYLLFLWFLIVFYSFICNMCDQKSMWALGFRIWLDKWWRRKTILMRFNIIIKRRAGYLWPRESMMRIKSHKSWVSHASFI